MSIHRGRNQETDGGAAAVEFAMVAMILVILLTGIIQFGYTFFEYIQVAHAAREGVRWGALGEDDAAVSARARAAAPALGADLQITVTWNGTESVAVTASHPITRLAPLADIVLPASVSSTAVQRQE